MSLVVFGAGLSGEPGPMMVGTAPMEASLHPKRGRVFALLKEAKAPEKFLCPTTLVTECPTRGKTVPMVYLLP